MKFVKILGSALAICLVLLGGLMILSFHHYKRLAQERHPDENPLTLRMPLQESWRSEGERIARMRGCADCHGADLGGKVFIDDPGMGYFVGPNLTRGLGGLGAKYSDDDFVRALRYGKSREGKYLRFMPSHEYAQMSDEDLGKLIVHLKSLPAIDRNFPDLNPGPLAKVLFYFGKMPLLFPGINIQAQPPVSLVASEDADYGRYLASSCTGCHRADFSGGPIEGVPPGWPPAADLSPRGNLVKWTFEEFQKAMTTGLTPEGRQLDAQYMPWTATAAMNEMELKALYHFLKTLP